MTSKLSKRICETELALYYYTDACIVSAWRFVSLKISEKYSTTPTSQKVEYLGNGGLSLNTPLKIRTTNGCCPTEKPSTSEWTDEIAQW